MKTAIDFLSLTRLGTCGAIALQLFLALPARAFSDTNAYWARECIAQLKQQKLLSGYPDGSFRPNATVTRTEFAILMLNAFSGNKKIRNAPAYQDVPADFWAADAIKRATERGFFAGYPDNTFRPQQRIPRVQGLVVLANAQQSPLYNVPEPILQRYFTDAGQIPNYAKGAIASLADREGIINYPNVRQLRPNANMTRGEVAAQICYYKGLKNLISLRYVTSEVNLYRDRFIFGPEIRAFGPSSQNLLMARGLNNKIGYISHGGAIVIPTRYNQAQPFSENFAAVADGETNRWGYIDLQGNWVAQPQYSSARPFSDGRAAVSLDGRKFGFIDTTGKLIIPLEYDAVLSFSEGLAAVAKNNQWGFIDTSGTLVISLQHPSVAPFSEGLARISSGERVGFIDKTGNAVIAPQFAAAGDFAEGLAPAADWATKRWGFIDKTGNWAIAPQFDAAQPFSEGLAGVSKEGKWGFIGKTGNIAIPLQFTSVQLQIAGSSYTLPPAVRPFQNGIAFARSGNNIGFINRAGNWVVEPTLFNDAEGISEGLARVHLGGEWIPIYDYPNNMAVLREIALEGGGWGYIRLPN